MAPSESPLSDAELLTRVRSRDDAAYGELYARHVAVARNVAYGLAGPHRGDDLIAEAFAKVLALLRRGQGPDLAFRPYLLATVRTVHLNAIRATKRESLVDDYAAAGAEESMDDGIDGLFEDAAIGRAYATLPERWQMVLWLTAVECRPNDEVGEILGIKANAVSALSFRAREGLRQAYLADHLQTGASESACRETVEAMPSYLRGTLGKRKRAAVEEHLDDCGRCAVAAAEVTQVNTNLGALLAPVFIGSAAAHQVWPHLWTADGAGKAAATAASSTKIAVAKLGLVAVAGTVALSALQLSDTVADVTGAAGSDQHERIRVLPQQPSTEAQPISTGVRRTKTPAPVTGNAADEAGPGEETSSPMPTEPAETADELQPTDLPSPTVTTLPPPSPSPTLPSTPSPTPTTTPAADPALGEITWETDPGDPVVPWVRVKVEISDPVPGTILRLTTAGVIGARKADLEPLGWECTAPDLVWGGGRLQATATNECTFVGADDPGSPTVEYRFIGRAELEATLTAPGESGGSGETAHVVLTAPPVALQLPEAAERG